MLLNKKFNNFHNIIIHFLIQFQHFLTIAIPVEFAQFRSNLFTILDSNGLGIWEQK